MSDIQKQPSGDARQHTLSLLSREHAEIGGVVEVKSFDEELVILDTLCGEMTVEGAGLRVGTLDLSRGMLVVDGTVNAIFYSTPREHKRKGLFGGVFRTV